MFVHSLREGWVSPTSIRVPTIALDATVKMEKEVLKIVSAVPGVKKAMSVLGRGESPADPSGPNESNPVVSMDPESGRRQVEIEEDIRKALTHIPGVQIVMNQPIAQRVDEMLTGVRSQLAIKIFGDDLNELKRLSEQVAQIVKTVPGARDIRVDRLSGQQTLTIDIDRRAIARHGINVADIHTIIETAIGGSEVSQLYEGERRYAIQLRYPESFRNSVDIIRETTLRTADNALIPLESVATIKLVDSPPMINRETGKRRVGVGGNAVP